MPESTLFGREYRITVYRTTSPSDPESFKVERKEDFDALQIRGGTRRDGFVGHKIEFEVERNLKRHANHCALKIINLNEVSRTVFKESDLYLVFEAGYNGTLSVIFEGDVTYALSEQKGTEWITHVDVADGDRMLATARIARSYRPGTNVRTVLADAFASVGQTLPDNIQSDPAFSKTLPRGYSAFGDLKQFMTKVLKPIGFTWSVQDGRIQVLSPEGTTNTRYVLSSAQGMIGSPEFGQPPRTTKKGKHKHPTVTVSSLLYPQLRPGGIVELQSRELRGTYKLLSVKHNGDFMGKDWTTEVEINPQGEVTDQTNQLGGNPGRPAQR